jgi:hypothetical protein
MQQVRRLSEQIFDQPFGFQVEFFQTARRLTLAQERGEFGELFPHPFDASVERNPWF